MGIFYTNITLFGPDQKQIVERLAQRRAAYVSPTAQNFTVVYDQETEDQKSTVLRELAASLSKAFLCPALAVMVQDGDVFLYWLYNNGAVIDEYDSTPGYLDSTAGLLPPTGGNAQILCAAFNASDSLSRVQQIFQKVINSNLENIQPEDYLIGEEIHRELAQALCIPPFGVEVGYYTIANGFLSDEFDLSAFVKCEARK